MKDILSASLIVVLTAGCGSDSKTNTTTLAPVTDATIDFKESDVIATQRAWDLAIRGEGFFVVESQDGDQFYTRAGSLVKNAEATLMSRDGHLVMAYAIDSQGQTLSQLEAINLETVVSAPKPTTQINLQINLDATASIQTTDIDASSEAAALSTSQFSTAITTYDSLGLERSLSIFFKKVAKNKWVYQIIAPLSQSGELAFNSRGQLISAPDTLGHFVLDFSNSTQFASPSTTSSLSQNGQGLGTLQSFNVTKSGRVRGSFDNGTTMDLYQIPLALFSNASKLARVANTKHTFAATNASGPAVIETPKTFGRGWIQAFAYESRYAPEVNLPDFSQGMLRNSTRPLDLAIAGPGFFMTEDSETNEILYTRKGSLALNSNNEITANDSGFAVQGYAIDSDGSVSASLAKIKISQVSTPAATNEIVFWINLNAGEVPLQTPFNPSSFGAAAASSHFSHSLTVYDSLGREHPVTAYFRKLQSNTWTYHLLAASTELEEENNAVQTPVVLSEGLLSFSSQGELASHQVTFARQVNWVGGAESVSALRINFSHPKAKVTQYDATDSSVNSVSQNGCTSGQLQSLNVTTHGIIMGTYSNGSEIPLAALALATFANDEGLASRSDWLHYYLASPLSGAPRIGLANRLGRGSVYSYALDIKYQ